MLGVSSFKSVSKVSINIRDGMKKIIDVHCHFTKILNEMGTEFSISLGETVLVFLPKFRMKWELKSQFYWVKQFW